MIIDTFSTRVWIEGDTFELWRKMSTYFIIICYISAYIAVVFNDQVRVACIYRKKINNGVSSKWNNRRNALRTRESREERERERKRKREERRDDAEADDALTARLGAPDSSRAE